MPASRGMMTRAASALLFAATLGFSLAFPGSAAESPEGFPRPQPIAEGVEGVEAQGAEIMRQLLAREAGSPGVGESDRVLGAGGFSGVAALSDLIHPNLKISDGNVADTNDNCELFGGRLISAPLNVGVNYCVEISESGFCVIQPAGDERANRLGYRFRCSGADNLYNRVWKCNLDENKPAASARACATEPCAEGLIARGRRCIVIGNGGEEAETVYMGFVSPSVTYDDSPSNNMVSDTSDNCLHLGGRLISAPLSVGINYCVGISESGFCVIQPAGDERTNRLGYRFRCSGTDSSGSDNLYNRVLKCNRDENKPAASSRACATDPCQNGLIALGGRCVAPPQETGPDIPDPPPACVGPCGRNALLFNANPPGGNLAVHNASGEEIRSGDLVEQRTQLTLTAEPEDDNWYVAGWTGCDNGQTGSSGDEAAVKRCVLHMPGELLSVSVSFGAASGRVLYQRVATDSVNGELAVVGMLSASSGGVSVANGDLLEVGTTLTMEAVPHDDFYVESWSGPCAGIGEVGDASSPDRVKECVLTVFGGMRAIGANFASKPRERLDPTTKDDSVTIVVVVPDPDNPPDGVLTVTLTDPTDVPVGRTIIISANPDDGMCVSEWTGACGGGVGETGCIGEADEQKTCVLVVTPGLDLDEINPVYIPSPNLFRVSYRGDGMGTVSAYSERAVPVPGDLASGGAVMEDARVSFLAVPAAGYYVAGWSGVCAGAPIGSKTAQGPLLGGQTCHWVADRDATGADEAVARFDLAPREPYTAPEIDAALPEQRRASRGAVVGYEGVILTVTTRDGSSSLEFVPSSSGGLEVDANGVVRSQGPVTRLLVGEFSAELSSANHDPLEVELDVRVSAVRPPANPEALKALVGDAVSGPALDRPFGYESGGRFDLLSNTYFSVDENTGAITGNAAPNNPPAGEYTLTIEFTHPDLAGKILLEAEVRIFSAESGVPDGQLNPGVIYLANGFPSSTELHRMGPDGANIEIKEVIAAVGDRRSSSTSRGAVRANVDSNSGGLIFDLNRRLSVGREDGGVFRFVETNKNTNDETIRSGTVKVQDLGSGIGIVHEVTEGLPGALAGDHLLVASLPINRTADPDTPAFSNIEVVNFTGNAAALAALTLGAPYQTNISARENLAAGGFRPTVYALTLTVRSRNGEFLGDQRLLLTVSVKLQDAVRLLLSDATGLETSPVVYAAPDYAGAGLVVSLGANLEFYSSDPAIVGGGSDFSVVQGAEVDGKKVAFTSQLLRALGDSEKTARVRVNVRCVAPKRCSPTALNRRLMNIVYRPAPARDQPRGTIPAGEAIERTALAPLGFEGGVFEELEGEYKNPADADLFTVSAAGAVSGGVLSVGTYKILVGYSTPNLAPLDGAGGFLGTVRLTLTVDVVARDIPLEEGLDLALLRPSVIAVSPDYKGDMLTLTLRGSRVTVTPAQGVAGGVFGWVQSGREVIFDFETPLNASGGRGVRITLVEGVSSDYRSRDAVVWLTVRGVTTAIPLIGGPGSTLVVPYQSSAVADLSQVDAAYAGATFTRLGAASPGLNLSSNGVVSTDGALQQGEYRITVDVSGPLFKGTARLTLTLSVQDKFPVAASRSIAEADRDRVIYAGPGYSGQAVVYRPVDPLVGLRTPSSAPAGLSFDAGTFGASGFTVSVQRISEGFYLDERFTVTALADDRSETPIELRLQIIGVDPVSQNPQDAEYGVASELAVLQAPSRISGGNFLLAGVDLGIDGSGGAAPSFAADDYNVDASGVDAVAQAVYYAPTPPRGDGGTYRVRAIYAHPELLGTVVYYQPVRVGRSRLTDAERIASANLSANLTVTPDYKGVFYSVSPQDAAAVDLIPGAPTDGRIVARNRDSDTVDFALPFALGGQLAAEATTPITESGGVNYEDALTEVHVRVSALAEVDVEQLGTLSQSEVRAGQPIHDFGTKFYGLEGVEFSAGAGTTPGLEVGQGGQVVVGAAPLGGGQYQVNAEASSPAGLFLGTVSFRLNFEVDPEPQPRDWGLKLADLNSPLVVVSPFHTGEVHRITLSADEAARVDLIPDPPSDPRLLASSAAGGDEVVFYLPAALGGERVLTAETRIQEDAGPNYTRLYETATVQLTSEVIPADRRLSFGVTTAMARPGAELLDFTTDPAYQGDALSFTPLSESGLAVDAGGTLRVGGATLAAGVYNIRAGAVSDDGAFLGTLYFRARVEVTLSPLPEGGGVRDADTASRGVLATTTAPGYIGEVIRITLLGDDVNIVNAPLTRNGVRAEQVVGREVVFHAESALDSQQSRLSQFDLEENTADGRHVSRRTQVGVRLRGTNTDLSAMTRGGGTVAANTEITDLRTKDPAYARATFGRIGSQSDDLEVVGAGVVRAKQELTVGSFLLTVNASGDDFRGIATMTVSLLVSSDQTVADADGVAAGLRGVFVTVAPEYAGSVAFFKPAAAGVTLRTPSSRPPGLVFDVNRDYDANLIVSLEEGAAPSAGRARTWSFIVTAKQSGKVDTPVELAVTVAAVTLPLPQPSSYTRPATGALTGVTLVRPSTVAYRNGRFTEVLRAEDGAGNDRVHPFGLTAEGTLTANNLSALDSGRYVVFAGYAADGFLGSLPLALTVDLVESPSEEIVVANREVVVYAGPAYAGTVYVAEADNPSDYGLSRTSSSHPDGFLFDNDALALALDGALGESERSGAVTLDVSCLDAQRSCGAATVAITVRVRPLVGPEQETVTVISGATDYRQNLRFPSEGRADENNQGRRLDVVGVSGPGGLLPAHFAVTRAGLLRYVGAGIPRGTHRITVRARRSAYDPAFFQGDILLVAILVAEDEDQLPLADANRALPSDARVTVLTAAEGYAGFVHQVSSYYPPVSLFFTPQAANNLVIDAAGVVRVAQPLAASQSGTFPVEARREGYAPRTRNVAVNVVKLDALRLTVSLTRLVDAVGDPLTLEVPNYPEAQFQPIALPAGLELFGARLRTTAPDGLATGRHFATLSATEPRGAFLGTLSAEAEFVVAPPPPVLPEADLVRVDLRSATLTVASGHIGSVAFFAAESADVILETPSEPPSGFAVDAGKFLGANGFTVSVTMGLSGRTRVGRFLVTAKREGSRNTAITLDAQVEWLAATPPIEIFGFVDALPETLATLAVAGFPGASFSPVFVGFGLSLDGATVRLDGPAVEGTYLLTATAESPEFVGLQTVSFRLEAEGGTVTLTRERALGAAVANGGLTVFGALGYVTNPLAIVDARSGVQFNDIRVFSNDYGFTGDVAGVGLNRWRRVLVETSRNSAGSAGFGTDTSVQFPREMNFRTNLDCYFEDGRECEPENLNSERVTVRFELVESPEQPLVTSTVNAAPFVPVQAQLRRPTGFETGGYFSKVSEDNLFEVDSAGGVSQTFPNQPLEGDRNYTVTAALTYPDNDPDGFKGTLEMALTIAGYVERIPIPDTDAIPPEQLRPGTIYVADGYPARSELHTASPRSQNLTVIIAEPLPQFSSDSQSYQDYRAVTLVGGTLSVPIWFQIQPNQRVPVDFHATLTLLAVDDNGEWDQRYAPRVEVMEFSTRRLEKYNSVGELAVEVQQAEPNALAGAELLTLSLIDEAPGAVFAYDPDRFQTQAMLRITLVGTNPSTLVARTDLRVKYGSNETPNVYIRVSDPTHGFRGTLSLTVTIGVAPGKPVTLTDDRAALPSQRFATVFAAQGVQGALYTMTLNPGIVFFDFFRPPGLLVRQVLDGRGLEVRLPGDARVMSDLGSRGSRVIVTCQNGVPCIAEGETVANAANRITLNWGVAIPVVDDPGQNVIRATVFDPFVGEALVRPTPNGGPTLFQTGGNFAEDPDYDFAHFFTVAAVNGTVSNEPIDLGRSETIIPAGLYDVAVKFDHPEMQGTLDIVAPVNMVEPPARFYRRNFDVSWVREIPDADHTLSGVAEAVFLGTRRNLTVMHVVSKPGAGDLLNSAMQAREFDRIRSFCAAGGAGWRLPGFSELGGILDDVDDLVGEYRLRSARLPGAGGDPAQMFALPYAYPANAADNYDRGSAIGSNPANGGYVSDYIVSSTGGEPRLAVARNDQADPSILTFGHDQDGNLDIICVRESDDSYQRPVDPAEIRINDERPDAAGVLLFTIFAAPGLPVNADYQTVTLSSWRFAAASGAAAPSVVPAGDNPVNLVPPESRLRVGANPTADGAGMILRIRPDVYGQDLQTSLVVFPQVGRTVTVSLSVLHPVFTFNGDPVYLPGDRVAATLDSGEIIQLEYHGSRRGLHVLTVATGGVGGDGVLPRDNSGGFNNLCVNSEEDDENTIRRFRPPTLGEIGGLLSDSAGPLTATLQQSAPPSANLPAGWLTGLEISLGLAYASFRDAITLADPIQHFSRNALGRRSVIDVDGDVLRLRDPADFPNGARAVCVLPDKDVPSDALPALRGVRLDAFARDDRGDNFQRFVYGDELGPLPAAGGVPDLRATAISSTEDPSGTRVFRGIFQHWRHRDNPQAAPGLPRLLTLGAELPGYDIALTNDPANHRALVEIFIGDPPPGGSARATLTILAASEFGQSIRAEIDVDNRPIPLDLLPHLVTREGIVRDINVAYGHFGSPPLTLSPSEGYTLYNPSSRGGGLNVSETGGTLLLAVASALTASRTERVDFTAECIDKAQCVEVSRFQATLNLVPVANPGQLFVSANEANVPSLDSGPLVPPVGFESGGTFYEDESAYAQSLHTLYFDVDSDTGAISATPGATITSDIYSVPVRFRHPDIHGDLPMEVAVEVAPAGAVLFFVRGALKDASFDAVGAEETRNVAPLGEPALSAGAIVARYVGVRRGLQIVHISPADGDDPLGPALRGGDFADIPAICDNLQFGWRMPTFLEALGIYHNSDSVDFASNIRFTKSDEVILPGYTDADSNRRFAVAGVPVRKGTDDQPPLTGNILINLPVAEKATGNPRLGSWEAPESGAVNFSGSVARRGVACVRPAVREYQTPADIPAGISANDEPARDGKLVAYLIRPDNYAAGQPYGQVELRSHRYDAAGNVVAVTDPAVGFSTGEPNGAGVRHTLLAETPAAGDGLWLSRTYAFAPVDPDAFEALAVTLALVPRFGASLTLEVNLLRQADLTPENALPVRQTAIAVAQGYVGRGYQLLPGPLYRLFGFTPGPDTDFEENGLFLNLGPGDVSDPNAVFEASVEFTAECLFGVCPGVISFGATVSYVPVSDPGQARVKATMGAAVGSLSGDALRRPAGYETGGTFEENVPAYQTPEHAQFFAVNTDTGAIGVKDGQTPTIGTYVVPVLFDHTDIIGKVSIVVDVEVLPRNAIAPFGTTYFQDDRKTITLSGVNDNHGLDLSGVDSIDAVYEGIWRDLEYVRVTVSGAGDVALNDLDSATGAEYAAVRAFCRDRGHGWRMLTFAEALGIASASPGFRADFTLAADLTIPGFEGGKTGQSDLPDPTADGNDVDSQYRMNVLADFIVLDNGRPAVAAFSDGAPDITDAHGGRRSRSGLFCVRPNSGAYAPVADPAGIEVNGAAFGVDGKTTLAVTLTRHDSLPGGGESARLTFRAWRLGNTGNTILAPDAGLSVSTDGAGVSAVEELAAPGRRVLRFAPVAAADQVIGNVLYATVSARPAVGRSPDVELQMNFARAISEGLVFPSRSARALIVDGYSGLLATVSSAPEYEVFDVAAFSNDSPVSVNIVSDSEFVLYLESAPSQGASFPVRTTMSARCASGECAEIVAAEYNVEVVIVRAPDQTPRRANSDGDPFDSGALNIPAEVPESNLNFQEAAGTDPRFTVDPNTGAVRSAAALEAGGYTVTVIYTAAPALLGTLTTELQIESAATKSPGLFGNQDIIDDIEVKADDHELEADSDLRASYGGTRRGLDFVVVQPVGGDSGGDGDPMRANLELPGGSGLAAIRNFCTSRGVGWRLPTPQEAAGLANLNNSGEVGFYFEYESIKSDPVTGKSGEVLRSDLQAPGMEGRLVSIDANTNRHVPPMRFSSLPNGLDSDSRLVFPNVLADHVVISAGDPIFASFQYDHVGTLPKPAPATKPPSRRPTWDTDR